MPTDRPVNRVTMREVAALAGVSFKTVSRVVNNETGVSADLARRVRDAAERLEYRPNLTASSLRRSDRRTRTVGVLLENIANPFSAVLNRAIEDAASARGVAVFAGSVDESEERQRELVTAFSNRRVDGLIVFPTKGDQSYLAAERRAGTAVVFVDRPPASVDVDVVLSANRDGADDAVTHLIAHGHRRIAYLGDFVDIYTAAERLAGYERALGRAGIPVDAALVRSSLHGTETAARSVHDLLAMPEPPTALFGSQNLITIGTITALRRLGRHRDVAVVGFDDLPLGDLLEPPVTVVTQDPVMIGTLAAELLFRRIDGDNGPSERHVLPTRLIVRGSGEIPPGG